MTSKLKCAFCNKDLILSYITDYLCCEECWESATEKVWQALIQAKQDLEQSEKCCSAWETQALDYKAETIALSGKLEITTKAMGQVMSMGAKNNICYHLKAKTVKSILGNALEKIEYKEI